MRVLLITGPGGGAQGWGDMTTTRMIREALVAASRPAEILYVESMRDLTQGLARRRFDLVWSALYHVSPEADFVGLCREDCWVADILDRMQIPYVGSDAAAMKTMIGKAETHAVLNRHGVPTPSYRLVEGVDRLPEVTFPAFVKPSCESESAGVAEESVVHSDAELAERVRYVTETFRQPALVEDYLPGAELTVSMIGNGDNRRLLPVVNLIDPSGYRRYPLIKGNMKQEGLVRLEIPGERGKEAVDLAGAAADAVGCLDHVRIDLREDGEGRLRVLEVNGIPGLNPKNSRSLKIYGMYHPSLGEQKTFQALVNSIVDSAAERRRRKLLIREEDVQVFHAFETKEQAN